MEEGGSLLTTKSTLATRPRRGDNNVGMQRTRDVPEFSKPNCKNLLVKTRHKALHVERKEMRQSPRDKTAVPGCKGHGLSENVIGHLHPGTRCDRLTCWLIVLLRILAPPPPSICYTTAHKVEKHHDLISKTQGSKGRLVLRHHICPKVALLHLDITPKQSLLLLLVLHRTPWYPQQPPRLLGYC